MRLLRRMLKHVLHSRALPVRGTWLLRRVLKPVLHSRALLRLVLHSRAREGQAEATSLLMSVWSIDERRITSCLSGARRRTALRRRKRT